MQRNIEDDRIEDMGTQYEQLFQRLPKEDLSAELVDSVLRTLNEKRAAFRRTRLWAGALGCLASVAGFIIALPLLIASAAASGFSALASLALTDSDAVFDHMGIFAQSLLETLPGIDVFFVLALMIALLASLRGLAHTLPPRSIHALT